MKTPEIPQNEPERLKALDRYAILDTDPEPAFDDLTKLAAHIAQVPIALVSLVDADRQWFKARYGLDAPETPRDVSFCGHVVAADAPLIVNDSSQDERFADNPLVVGEPRVMFYAGSPLRTPDGFVVGTLCVIDNSPNSLTEEQQTMLELLAQQVVDQLELRRRNIRLQTLANVVETSFDAIVTRGLAGNIMSWNRAAEQLFGFSADEVVGQRLQEHVPPECLGEEARFAEQLQAGQVVDRVDTVRVHKDGQLIDVSLTVSPLFDRAGTLIGTSQILRDITERKSMERMKAEFVSTVSHELRTPLTSIRGSLGLVAGGVTGELPPEAKEYVDIAVKNSDRLVRLINDILDIEKMQSGRMDFRFQCIELSEAVEVAIAENKAYALDHDTSIELAASVPDGEVVVDVDRLAQIFANLLSNAAKFTAAGTTVTVEASLIGREIELVVRDFGPGIPEEFRPRVFERFSQADSSTTRRTGGSGLGLAITKAIVERMHGTIGFRDGDGVGTEFFVRLPFYPAVAESADVSGPRVLVCEDDPDVTRFLTELLTGAGYDTDCAPTIERAKRLLDAGPYAAITLDLALADGPGTTLLDWVRTHDTLANTPVVVVSGSASIGDRGVFVSDVLSKPVDEGRLISALERAIEGNVKPRILHVEDETDLQKIIRRTLPQDWEVVAASTVAKARKALSESDFDVVVLDLDLPDGSGESILSLVGDASVIIFSAFSAPEDLANRVASALVKSHADPSDVRQTILALLNTGDLT